MKKVLKSKIFIIVILCIISCGIGIYAANTYEANTIRYTPSNGEATNVDDALNEIYSIKKLGNASASDITNGKTAVVQGKLITGTKVSTNTKFIEINKTLIGNLTKKNIHTFDASGSAYICIKFTNDYMIYRSYLYVGNNSYVSYSNYTVENTNFSPQYICEKVNVTANTVVSVSAQGRSNNASNYAEGIITFTSN